MPRRSKLEDGLQEKVGSDNLKDELRRVRNRLSQRAIRERRAIRIQQLEQELAQTRQTDSEARFNELRAENDKLRNGLHTTRKKLLSISTTTSSVADAVRTLLDLDPAKEEPEDEETTQAPVTRKDEHPASLNLAQESPSTEEIIVEQQHGLRELFPEQFGPGLDLEDLTVKPSALPTFSSRKHQLGTDMWGTSETWNDDSLMDPISRIESTATTLNQQSLANLTNTFDDIPLTDGALILSSKRSVSNFSDHLEYIFKLLRLSGISEHFSSAPMLLHSLLHCFIQQCWPFMDHWFQITNACATLRTVMWWQTTKSAQAFLEISGTHSPTPSQLVLSYPCIIDWISHPAIRNVMVTNYDMYDVDQVICDMTDAYVVEDNSGYHAEPLNVMETVQRYHTPAEDTRILGHSHPNPMPSHLHSQSQFLHTYRVQNFKIDPSFFVKYPSLYDASAIAKTPCASIRIHERSELQHRPLHFTAANANVYLDAVAQAKATAFR